MTDDHTSVPSSEDVALALRHCWQPVARLEDLKDGPQRAVLLDQPLAVFLTESGEVAVVADRCAHRGAQLSMGKVRGDCIQCPYHGWEWAGDGSWPGFRHIPAVCTGGSSGRRSRSR
jgi:phenylpropionate dioxygenase-like ring-hydroxylating dioxygenase large terminal subunit